MSNLSESVDSCISLSTLDELIDRFGISKDSDGNVKHCDEYMQIGYGLVGSDIATCKICGLQIVNMMSPHINGGYVFDDIETNNRSWLSNHDLQTGEK